MQKINNNSIILNKEQVVECGKFGNKTYLSFKNNKKIVIDRVVLATGFESIRPRCWQILSKDINPSF